MFTDTDFSNEAIAAAVRQADEENFFEYTPSRKEVEAKTENSKFDAEAYWVWTLSGKNSHIDSFKLEELQAKGKSRIFSKVTTLINKGHGDDFIIESLKDSIEAHAFGKKRPERFLQRVIDNQRMMDFHNHSVRVFWDYVNWITFLSSSKKIQKDTKKAMPLLTLLVTLTQARNSDRDALVATKYVSGLAGSTYRASGAILALFAEGNQARKWKAYEKVGMLKFTAGAKGGASNKVELFKFEEETSEEDRLAAVEDVLSYLQDGLLKDRLEELLNYVAKLTSGNLYGDCILHNLVEDVTKEFVKLADKVIDNRKAERLIESADFAEELVQKFEEMDARISNFLASGQSLFGAKLSEVGEEQEVQSEVVLEAPEIDSKPLSEPVGTKLRVPEFIQAETPTEHLESIRKYAEELRDYKLNSMLEDLFV